MNLRVPPFLADLLATPFAPALNPAPEPLSSSLPPPHAAVASRAQTTAVAPTIRLLLDERRGFLVPATSGIAVRGMARGKLRGAAWQPRPGRLIGCPWGRGRRGRHRRTG